MNTDAIPPSDRMWPSSFRMPHGSRNHTLSTGLDERPGGSRWSGRCAVTVPRRDGVTFGGRRVTMMARVLRGRHGRTANTRSPLGSPEHPVADGTRLPREGATVTGQGAENQGAHGPHHFLSPGGITRPAGPSPGFRGLRAEPGAFGRHPPSQDPDPRKPLSSTTPHPPAPTPPMTPIPRDRRQEVASWTPAWPFPWWQL
jgi:hypothetical protein